MAARDLSAAPPNIYQLEEAEFDLEKATAAQQSNDDVDAINKKVAENAEKDAEVWEKKRDERVAKGEGVHLGDPLKTDKSTPGSHETKSTAKKTDSK